MPKKLLAVNVVLVVACALFVALMIRTSRAPWPAEPPRARPPAATTAPPPSPPDAAPAPAAYGVIAARNLFSPTRSEAPPAPVAPTVALPKPNLFGVVVRDGASIAYLEDPVTKRVAGYRQGDAIAGGTVQTISSDRVVLARPEGNVDVRLHDPSRPRPPAPPAAGRGRRGRASGSRNAARNRAGDATAPDDRAPGGWAPPVAAQSAPTPSAGSAPGGAAGSAARSATTGGHQCAAAVVGLSPRCSSWPA